VTSSEALSRFEGLHRGRRGFVLGTGMSIAVVFDDMQIPTDRLNGEVVVGCKQVHRRVPLTYWVSMDVDFYLREKPRLAAASFVKFTPAGVEGDDPTVVELPPRRAATEATALPRGLADVDTGGDTGLVALRIAYVLGLRPIYLLGMNDPMYRGRLHFHDESKRPRSPRTVVAMGEPMRAAIAALGRAGVAVYSCSPISELNRVVPYVDIRTLDLAGP
jgi:hypothetical protein